MIIYESCLILCSFFMTFNPHLSLMYSALVLDSLVLWCTCVCWEVVWIPWQMELGELSSMFQMIYLPDVEFLWDS